MLPRILCEDLCSLNSGVERLSFSVVWKMDDEANILEEWFGRSVICSCIKMAYEHAQKIIENPDTIISKDALPKICNGKCAEEIQESVLNLDRIARKLKEKRINNGALKLNSLKLKFTLDAETQLPLAICTDEVFSMYFNFGCLKF